MVSLSDQKRKHQPFGSKQKKLKNQKNGKQQEKKGVKTFSFSIRCFLLEDGDLEIFFYRQLSIFFLFYCIVLFIVVVIYFCIFIMCYGNLLFPSEVFMVLISNRCRADCNFNFYQIVFLHRAPKKLLGFIWQQKFLF
jgi:hypothetical protein